jgi:flagellum-specific peptidoglycan hydrolase FlgJ
MKKEYLSLIPGVLIFFILLGFSKIHTNDQIITKKIGVDTFQLGYIKVNDSVLLQKLIKLNIKHPEIVLKQAKLETGNYKSNYYTKNYNLFGFRTKNGYKKYNYWMDACKDYKQWQDKNYNTGDYYKFLLNVGYAEDSMYIYKLKHMK